MMGFKMKFSEIPMHIKAWATVIMGMMVITAFIHNYAHAAGDAVLEQHLKDFNGLVKRIDTNDQRRAIQNATSNINFIDEKLAADNVSEKLEKVLLRNREHYVDLRECYREERPVCE